MAYWTEKNGKKWLYHKNPDGSYISPIELGFISDAEADIKVAQWKIDNGKSPTRREERTMMSVYHQYLKYMVDHEYSQKTINDAPTCLLAFIHTVPMVRDLSEKKVREWEQALIDWRYKRGPKATIVRKLTPETIQHRLRVIKSFINWMVAEKIIVKSPCKIVIPQGRKDAGTDLAGKKRAFLDAIAPRSRVIAELIIGGGLRVSNALELLGKWIDHDRGSLKLPKEVMKNNDGLELFLSKRLMAMLPKDVPGLLFPDMTVNILRNDWKAAATAIGLKRFRIHDGRVTSASQTWRRTKDVKLLKERFGWRDVRTAMHYVKVTEDEHRSAAELSDSD